MSEIQELYQQVVLDHNKRPRNYRKLEDANRTMEGYNPLCGDHIFLYLKLEDDVIKDIGFEGSGCAISKASTSMMTESVKGKSKGQVQALFDKFHAMVTGAADTPPSELGKLMVLAGVRAFPIRVKCATLAWHTLRAALEKKAGTISTE